MIGEKGAYDFFTENVKQIPEGAKTVRFGLPPVKDVLQVTIKEKLHGLALLFFNGDLGFLSDESFDIIDNNVERIFPVNGSELIYLKSDGTLAHADYSGVKTIHRFDLKELITIKDIAAGKDHFILLKTDGSLWVWGKNEMNQLGLPDTGPATSPRKLKW